MVLLKFLFVVLFAATVLGDANKTYSSFPNPSCWETPHGVATSLTLQKYKYDVVSDRRIKFNDKYEPCTVYPANQPVTGSLEPGGHTEVMYPSCKNVLLAAWRNQFNSSRLRNGLSLAQFKEAFLALPDIAKAKREMSINADRSDWADHERVERKQSVDWTWGHDYVFGEGETDEVRTTGGYMTQRHFVMLALAIDGFGLPSDLNGLEVLDLGAYNGALSFALASLGARVTAVEEVQQYCDTIDLVASSYSLPIVSVPQSLYKLVDMKGMLNKFDVVFFYGVLYHLSDPLLALRVCYDVLKPGGILVLESEGLWNTAPGAYRLEYQGLRNHGNNWFSPTAPAMQQMLSDMGFSEVSSSSAEITRYGNLGRIMAAGRRSLKWTDFLRSGFSRTDLC